MYRRILISSILILVLAVTIPFVFATVFSSTFDTSTPAGTDSPTEADDRMREIKAAVQERQNVDHFWDLTGTQVSDADSGEHRKILFHAPIAATPTVAADHGDLRTADVSAKAELHWTDEDENEIQLTSGGNLHTSTGFTMLTGQTAAIETIIAVDATGILLQNDSPVTVVTIGDDGTATLADSSQMASTAAPTDDEDIANKKYIDDQIAALGSFFGVWNDRDDDGGADSVANNTEYAAATDGLVIAYGTPFGTGVTARMQGLTDGNSPPTTVRARCNDNGGSNAEGTITFPVKKSDNWKVTGADVVFWMPIGS